MIRPIATLAPDAVSARLYAQIKRGLIMSDNDLWIAATVTRYDVTLAARHTHFTWVTGLRVEQW